MVAEAVGKLKMRAAYKQFIGPLTPGVRLMLLILTVFYVLTLAGELTHRWSVYPWVGLSGPAFWHGHIWKVVTYALVPASVLDALFNWVMILFMGSWLEREWTRGQMWLICLSSTLCTGLVWVLVRSSSELMLVGTTPIVFGMLAAWGWLCGHQRVLFWFMWDMSVRQVAIVMTIFSWLMMALACAGPVIATIMLAGSVAGLLHIWIYLRLLRARPGQAIDSERIGRLEL